MKRSPPPSGCSWEEEKEEEEEEVEEEVEEEEEMEEEEEVEEEVEEEKEKVEEKEEEEVKAEEEEKARGYKEETNMMFATYVYKGCVCKSCSSLMENFLSNVHFLLHARIFELLLPVQVPAQGQPALRTGSRGPCKHCVHT